MCRPDTKQAFAVLRAFAEAGKPLSRSELEERLQLITNAAGYGSVDDIGPEKLQGILNELAKGRAIVPAEGRRRALSERGEALKNALGVLVEKSEPALFQGSAEQMEPL